MTNRNRIILSGLAAIAVLAVTLCPISTPGPPDPIYDGHRISHWVSVPLNAQTFSTLPHDLDSNAVPYLVHTLNAHDGWIRKAYINCYFRLPSWIRNRLARPVPAANQRFCACVFLGSMGRTARPAISELVCMTNPLDERHSQTGAIYALSMIATRDDADVMAALHAASKDKDPYIRNAAVVALQQLDPQIGPDP